MLLVAEETPAFSAVELATVGCPAMVVISCEAILLCLSISSCFIDIAPADFNFLDGCAVCNFLDGCTDENSSVCLLSDDGLRGNAPNLLTSIGVAQDLREEPDRSLKLRSGLSSYGDVKSSLPRQAQKTRPIIATNAIAPTAKTTVEPESSSAAPDLEDFLIVVTSGRVSASEDKTLVIATFSVCDKEYCVVEVCSSRYLLLDAEGGLKLLELGIPDSSSSSCLFPETPRGKGKLCSLKQSRKVLATSADKVVVIRSLIFSFVLYELLIMLHRWV